MTHRRSAAVTSIADVGITHPANVSVDALLDRVRLLEAVIENFPGGLLLFDAGLRLIFCNEHQKKLLDYPASLFAHGPPRLEDLIRYNALRGEYGEGDVEEFVQTRMALAREHREHSFERVRPNGTVIQVRGAPIVGGGFVTTYLDVTEQHEARRAVRHLAYHDALTDLPNRMLLGDRMQQALARVDRGDVVAVMCLDLDRFKPVNDAYGHAVGDLLLKSVAERLRIATRATDTVARVGGDEFVVLQVGIHTRNDAEVLARRLSDVLSSPFLIADLSITIGASIGVAMAPWDKKAPMRC